MASILHPTTVMACVLAFAAVIISIIALAAIVNRAEALLGAGNPIAGAEPAEHACRSCLSGSRSAAQTHLR